MKILSASVTNFGSYKSLEFDFSNQGLTLISGPTGAGKSTLCDVIPWILFGRTAKNGTVDEIRSWNSSGQTYGEINVEVNGIRLTIERMRNPNDLVYNGNIRGKDLNDTQKLINNLLGLDADLYLSGAYFHEFSQTAAFFTSPAKLRRQIIEQMVDLSLAKKLNENVSDYKKELKKEQEQLAQSIVLMKDRLQHLNIQLTSIRQKYGNWFIEHKAKLEKLEEQYTQFDRMKIQQLKKLEERRIRYDEEAKRDTTILTGELEKLTSSLPQSFYGNSKRQELEQAIKDCDKELCKECGAPKKNTQKMVLIDQLHNYKMEEQKIAQIKAEIVSINNSLDRNKKLTNPYPEQIKQEEERTNTYFSQLEASKAETNPYDDQVFELNEEKNREQKNLDTTQSVFSELRVEFSDIELLLNVTEDFRSVLVKNIISELQHSVNKLLTDHFDAEIKVTFDVADNDKLDVTISKDGNECSYSQLSKGQRQLLKLCFGISVMKAVSNHSGVSFNCLFMDEAFEGLSEQLKIQSYGLLQRLSAEYESVFVVEHSQELKNMFTNRIDVSLINGESRIAKA